MQRAQMANSLRIPDTLKRRIANLAEPRNLNFRAAGLRLEDLTEALRGLRGADGFCAGASFLLRFAPVTFGCRVMQIRS